MGKQRNPKGMGNFKKRNDGRYEYRITVDGKTRYLYDDSLADLKAKAEKLSRVDIKAEKATVREWFERWLENVILPLKKPATYNQYNFLYKGHILPEIGSMKLTNVKTIDVQAVIATANKKGLSSETMKHIKKVLRLGFDAAMESKLISENPVKDIDIPKKQAKTRKTLKADEIGKLFDAMKNSRWVWSVKFDLTVGIRRGELLALKWEDVDFDNKKILIKNSLSDDGVGDTKSAKARYVPLSDSAIKFLNKQKDMLFSEGLTDCELIFPNNKGDMLRPDSYYTMLSRFAKKAGIYAHPHCLRHTFVYLTRGQLDLKDLQSILGHEKSTQTLDIYGDIINENNDDRINAIDNAFEKLETAISDIEKKKAKGKIIKFERHG